MHFEYFEAIRKIVAEAKIDAFFIDPYLDADFVSRYLTQVDRSVQMRLLTKAGKSLTSLLPAIDVYVKQSGAKILIREGSNLHDRFVLIHRVACYQSGSSFKDGPRNADSTVTQIIDVFTQVRDAYETRWAVATVHR